MRMQVAMRANMSRLVFADKISDVARFVADLLYPFPIRTPLQRSTSHIAEEQAVVDLGNTVLGSESF